MHQNAYRVCRQGQCAVGVFRFQRGLDHLAVLPGYGPLHLDHSAVEIYIRPFQPQQFVPPQSGGEIKVVELVHAAVPGFLEEGAELVGSQRFHLLVFDFWQGAALRRVAGYQLLLHGEIVRRADHLVDVPHGLWR